MRIIISCFFLSALSFSLSAQHACKNRARVSFDSSAIIMAKENSPWKLVFEDDFNSPQLDSLKWLDHYPWGRNLVNNPERQYYGPDNYVIENGILKLVAKKENIKARVKDEFPDAHLAEDGKANLREFPFSSGMIFSREKFRYGKFEIRCKIPEINGMWPAFWIFGQFPYYEEIDAFEFMDEKNNTVDFTVHGQPDQEPGVQRCNMEYKGIDYTKDFHVYAVEWDSLKIAFSIDGVVKKTYYHYHKLSGANVRSFKNIKAAPKAYLRQRVYPKQVMHVIVNLAVKHAEGNFPAVFEVDYVRVYQR
ncbi:MAG: glycoside hydrolase family 16 protein [Cytophagaceae bacterium]|nr:glycoside hydrolase family 16 protein [Cytophagaceae bacterium]